MLVVWTAVAMGTHRWAVSSSECAAPTQDGGSDVDDSLPRIGAPATRALAQIGVTRLSQLTDHRAEDLLNLHGVGPKAVRLLQAALVERGMSFDTRADSQQ
jgi:hypothetical protein